MNSKLMCTLAEDSVVAEPRSAATPGAWLTGWITIGSALILRASRGYRPFPSIDDFNYVPLARAQLDYTVYPNDSILQEFVSHVPLWPILVRALDLTFGLPLGLWLITLLLSIATLCAVLRWMQALGAEGILLPFAAVIAFSAKLPGLGRGEFDGAFGDAFHMQWLALCVLLWTYDAILRSKAIVSGVLLGITAICHPVVAAHGALAVTCAAIFSGRGRWKRLVAVSAISLVISSPISVPLLFGLVNVNNDLGGAKPMDIAELGFLFRTNHEYEVQTAHLALFLLFTAAGLAGIASLYECERTPSTGAFFGLQLGHLLLLGSVAFFHSDLFPNGWMSRSLVPFQLHLTRTTPILLTLSAVALTTAVERECLRGNRRLGKSQSVRIGWLCFWSVCGVTLLFCLLACVEWTLMLMGMLLLCLMTMVLRQRFRGLLISAWCVAASLGICWFSYSSQLEASVSARDKQLYQWVRTSTPRDALFIIPPGQLQFRYYAERSVYVDFKFFVSATPARILPWRRRLEEVAAPDKLAMKSKGWPGIAEWDRTYANRNTPSRIAKLLGSTKADYLLWNAEGLDVPPYVPVPTEDDPRVEVVYERDGYKVYQLLSES